MMTARQDALTVLGIETSCDETAAALVRRDADGRGEILSNVVRSQLDLHAVYGGGVPEIAARAHVDRLDAAIKQALAEAGSDIEAIGAVAAAAGPGLAERLDKVEALLPELVGAIGKETAETKSAAAAI